MRSRRPDQRVGRSHGRRDGHVGTDDDAIEAGSICRIDDLAVHERIGMETEIDMGHVAGCRDGHEVTQQGIAVRIARNRRVNLRVVDERAGRCQHYMERAIREAAHLVVATGIRGERLIAEKFSGGIVELQVGRIAGERTRCVRIDELPRDRPAIVEVEIDARALLAFANSDCGERRFTTCRDVIQVIEALLECSRFDAARTDAVTAWGESVDAEAPVRLGRAERLVPGAVTQLESDGHRNVRTGSAAGHAHGTGNRRGFDQRNIHVRIRRGRVEDFV